MITKSAQTLEYSCNWQRSLAQAIRDPAELLERLQLPKSLLPAAKAAAENFPLRVPLPYLERIEPGNPQDPLLRQILPLAEETAQQLNGQQDPVGDLAAMKTPGLIHKYHGRALLVSTGACAIHCRYCFRRHFPYGNANPFAAQWQHTLDYLGQHTEINEVILSGGDPLSLVDQRIQQTIQDLEQLPHLDTLRIHSRLPVVLPERITESLCQNLTHSRLNTVMVLHVNHPREIDFHVNKVAQKLANNGITLLNQSVLLRGVNDTLETLESLSRTLFAAGILPYYLHQFDPVQQAMHFEVPVERGQALVLALRKQLPGYLVPRFVQEIPAAASKIPL